MRSTLLLLALALALLVGATIVPSSAHAGNGGPVYATPTNDANLTELLRNNGSTRLVWRSAWNDTLFGGNPATATQQATRDAMIRGSQASRMLPTLKVLGTVGLTASAFALGWKIGRALDTKWLHLSAPGVGTTGTPQNMAGSRWKRYEGCATSGGDGGSTRYYPTGCTLGGTEVWWLYQATTTNNVVVTQWRECYGEAVTPDNQCGVFYPEMAGTAVNLVKPSATLTGGDAPTVEAITGTDGQDCNSSTRTSYRGQDVTCGIMWMTNAQMKARIHYDGYAPYTSQAFDVDTSVSTWRASDGNDAPGTTTVSPAPSADLDRARKAIDPTDGTTESPTGEAEAWTNHQLDGAAYPYDPGNPSGGGSTVPNCRAGTVASCQAALNAMSFQGGTVTFTETITTADLTVGAGLVTHTVPAVAQPLPQTGPVTIYVNPDPLPFVVLEPLINERYSEYLTRLQQAGYVGTATQTVLSEQNADPRTGPDAVSRTIPRTGTRILNAPGTGIEVFVNPHTATPVEGGGTPIGGGAAAEPCCPVNSIDFSPITSIDYGSKFPFGMFAYAFSILDIFDVPAVAPHFEFAFPSIGGRDGVPLFMIPGGGEFVVDLAPFSDYMATIRGILSFVMTAGFVWFLATRMLKFDATGDPGGAVDEVI